MKNIKFIIAAFLLTSFSQVTFSQTSDNDSDDSAKLRFGIKGGVNFSNMNASNVKNNDYLTGFNAGIFAKIPFAGIFALQPELLYTTKGAKLTYDNYFVNGSAKFNMNYLELPVLLVINLSKNFNVHAGPYVAYLIDGKATNDAGGTLFDIQNNLNNKNYNRFDTGLAFGLGYDASNFGIGVRYNYGMQKVGKESSFLGTNYTFPDGKNSVVNLYLSLSFL